MAAPSHLFGQFYNSYLTVLTFQCGIELRFQSSSQEKLMIQKWFHLKLMVGQSSPSIHGVKGFGSQPCGDTKLEGCSIRSSSAPLRIIEHRCQSQFPFSLFPFHYKRDGSFQSRTRDFSVDQVLKRRGAQEVKCWQLPLAFTWVKVTDR